MQILITMTMRALHTSIFVLVTIATIVQRANHIAPQAVYQKLEHALITDSKVRYLMQHTFFPSQGSSPDIIYICVNVTIDSMLLGSCDEHHPVLTGTPMNLSYYQVFQWSSSHLLNIISVDQLLILDNVISESIYKAVEHRQFLPVSLHINTLPCNTSEDDLLKALMQLLPWVCTSVHACIIMICMDCTEMA